MRNLKLTISYDGTDYCGWQVQPNGVTIQQVLADAIEKVTGTRALPVGASRTDSGVHALGQVAHWHTTSLLPAEVLQRALNANLPAAIVVTAATEAPDSFDACDDAKGKLYRYVFHDSPLPDVFTRRYCWKVHERLEVSAMAEAARVLVGTHDFRCFESAWPNRKTSVRTIAQCAPVRFGDYVYLDLFADGFLYNMARAIAGTLREIGRGRWPIGRLSAVLTGGDRAAAGPTAPARGLFLIRVDY